MFRAPRWVVKAPRCFRGQPRWHFRTTTSTFYLFCSFKIFWALRWVVKALRCFHSQCQCFSGVTVGFIGMSLLLAWGYIQSTSLSSGYMAWHSIYGIFLHCSRLVSALASWSPPTLLTTTNRNFSLTLFTSSESVIALKKRRCNSIEPID